MAISRTWIVIVAVLITPGCSRCGEDGAVETAAVAGGERAPVQSAAPDRGRFDLGLVWAGTPPRDPIDAFRETCAAIPIVEELPAEPTGIAAVARVPEDYAAPDMETLAYFGRGLTEERALAIQRAPIGLVIAMESTPARACEAAQALTTCAGAIAAATGALVWDETTRLMYSADAWRDGPVRDWDDGVPSMAAQTTVHAVPTESGGLRAVSLGMHKFARSDIVIARFEEHHWDGVGRLLTWLGQTMIEGAEPGSEIALDATSIRDPQARDAIAASTRATIQLRPAPGEPGDPENRLLEPVFPGGDGAPLLARQAELLRTLFTPREISHVDEGADLERLAQEARGELRAMRDRFVAGLPAAHHLHVAAVFPVGEIMWVDVTAWPAPDRLVGRLLNEPQQSPTLHSGATVEIAIEDVMDYMLLAPEGRIAGGTAYERATGGAAR